MCYNVDTVKRGLDMENRNNLLRIRVSDKEKELLQKKSRELGLDMSSYCRFILFASLNQQEMK